MAHLMLLLFPSKRSRDPSDNTSTGLLTQEEAQAPLTLRSPGNDYDKKKLYVTMPNQPQPVDDARQP